MKRNTLTTAVMAGLTGMAGMMSVANAVNVNPDGLGQVLLYPYYTARGGNDTLISVVNTTSAGKAVKVRFIEALNSREVLDFNIYLSEFDVWTAAITDLEALDLGDGPGILTTDQTCTTPYFFGDRSGVQEFVDFGYNSAPVESLNFDGTIDGGPSGIERAASGHFEIIEMGTIDDDSDVGGWITHDAGVPADCASVVDLWRTPPSGAPAPAAGELGFWRLGDDTFGFDLDAGLTGGLFGAASIINVNNGTMFTYNATAVDAFFADTTPEFHTAPEAVTPSLNGGTNRVSNVFANGSVETIDWFSTPGSGSVPFPLNAALTLSELMNEYTLNAVNGGTTEWVLTFPTKRFHTDAAPGGPRFASGTAVEPFTEVWTQDAPFACEEQTFKFWDREENVPVDEPGDPGGVGVSPPGPPTEDPAERGFVLCRETNVIRFANDGSEPDATEILAEPFRADADDSIVGDADELSYTNLNLPEGFNSGWVKFDFTGFESRAGSPIAGVSDTVVGFPVIGFSANTFTNGALPNGTLSNYGGTFKHRGTRQSAVGN